MFATQSVKMSSHTSLSDHRLLKLKIGWIMTLTLLHKRIKFAQNVYKNLGLKIRGVVGTYRRLLHTVLSCIVSFVSAFLSKMFDVGDLPVLTFGNCTLKAGVIKWPVKLYVYTFICFTFFKSINTTY